LWLSTVAFIKEDILSGDHERLLEAAQSAELTESSIRQALNGSGNPFLKQCLINVVDQMAKIRQELELYASLAADEGGG